MELPNMHWRSWHVAMHWFALGDLSRKALGLANHNGKRELRNKYLQDSQVWLLNLFLLFAYLICSRATDAFTACVPEAILSSKSCYAIWRCTELCNDKQRKRYRS
jgi:hypothetical protein